MPQIGVLECVLRGELPGTECVGHFLAFVCLEVCIGIACEPQFLANFLLPVPFGTFFKMYGLQSKI